jgi:hypothetical protein
MKVRGLSDLHADLSPNNSVADGATSHSASGAVT